MSTTSETTGQQVLRIADEVRVRLHLAGMDAKATWEKLEPKVMDLERRLERAAGKASDEIDKIAIGLQRELQHLHERLTS